MIQRENIRFSICVSALMQEAIGSGAPVALADGVTYEYSRELLNQGYICKGDERLELSLEGFPYFGITLDGLNEIVKSHTAKRESIERNNYWESFNIGGEAQLRVYNELLEALDVAKEVITKQDGKTYNKRVDKLITNELEKREIPVYITHPYDNFKIVFACRNRDYRIKTSKANYCGCTYLDDTQTPNVEMFVNDNGRIIASDVLQEIDSVIEHINERIKKAKYMLGGGLREVIDRYSTLKEAIKVYEADKDLMPYGALPRVELKDKLELFGATWYVYNFE